MEQWIEDDLLQFQNMYTRYSQDDPALGSCAMMMVKILNGLSEMTFTQFHRYEKKMLWKAMRLFSGQCIEQIGIAADKEGTNKKEYIEDLEVSISEIAEVYRNTMGDVSNVERQTFQSLAVDAKMYDLSPKLCAFYSSILEKVVAMFQEDGMEYAFVLHPMLRSTIEAKVLLEKRENSGKVVIIYIPEEVMEKFDLVCICLIHETFHILTKKERNRQKRMICFMNQMIWQTQNLIFENVFFGAEDRVIKEKLMTRWFDEIKQQIGKYKKEDSNKKAFYGERVRIEAENKIKDCLKKINTNLENDVEKIAVESKKYKDYTDFVQHKTAIMNNINNIKNNIFYIASENKIAVLCERLMFLYRETYADIACILLLEIDQHSYDKAFEDSIRFKYNTMYWDDVRELREKLVGKVISEKISSAQQDSWIQYMNQVTPNSAQSDSRQNCEQKEAKSNRQNEGGYVNLFVDEYIKRNFMQYLRHCADDFLTRLQYVDGVETFRQYIREVITGESQQLLIKILGGDIVK